MCLFQNSVLELELSELLSKKFKNSSTSWEKITCNWDIYTHVNIALVDTAAGGEETRAWKLQ